MAQISKTIPAALQRAILTAFLDSGTNGENFEIQIQRVDLPNGDLEMQVVQFEIEFGTNKRVIKDVRAMTIGRHTHAIL